MDDLDDLAALSAEESFWRYPFGRGWSRSETESSLERTIERFQDPGVAVSAVVVSDTGELAGWAGLSVPMFLPEILPAVEHGVRLHVMSLSRAVWCRGETPSRPHPYPDHPSHRSRTPRPASAPSTVQP
jgi:hypothetical protein